MLVDHFRSIALFISHLIKHQHCLFQWTQVMASTIASKSEKILETSFRKHWKHLKNMEEKMPLSTSNTWFPRTSHVCLIKNCSRIKGPCIVYSNTWFSLMNHGNNLTVLVEINGGSGLSVSIIIYWMNRY